MRRMKSNSQKIIKEHLVRAEDIKGKLKQWRILFYLDALRDIDMQKLHSIKEKDENLFIQIKIFEYVTKFELILSKFHTSETQRLRSVEKLTLKNRLNTARTKRPSNIKSKFKNLISRSSDGSFEIEDIPIETDDQNLTQRNSKMNFRLNKLRVHYFFTE